MTCFSWMHLRRNRHDNDTEKLMHPPDASDSSGLDIVLGGNDARSFTFRELETATKTFRDDNLIGEGGFGKVYKGHFYNGQEIAVKRLNSNGQQGNQEFIVEVLMLRLLHHPNHVKLIGYCAEEDHRLLVYEYMCNGSLADHLYENGTSPVLDWKTRMKIAVGAAKGIQYLHCSEEVPIIYRDLKSANILLDSEFNPRLSDFGLAKLGPTGDQTHVSTRIMGTYGYCAPEYAMSGKLTVKSDIYSFGVVLLELVSGRKAYDPSKNQGERSIVAWGRALIRDKERSIEVVDARLEGQFPEREAQRLITTVISSLLEVNPNARPAIKDIVDALVFLAA